MQQRIKIIDSFSLLEFSAGQVIFRKGDPSSCYYFVLEGVIEAFNEQRDGTIKPVGKITYGKALGEIGILRNQPRSLTCIAKTKGWYLTLRNEEFISLLASHMFKTLDQKIQFIETYFPNVKKLTTVQKQRIAYAMGNFSCSRGQRISTQKEFIQYLCFINEGELIVNLISEKSLKSMTLKLAPGNIIGEECVFFNTSLRYNISVSSEHAHIYTLQKKDLLVLLPPETLELWKSNFKAKVKSRGQFIEGLGQNRQVNDMRNMSFSHFTLASSYAKKRLDLIKKRNEISISTDSEEKSAIIGKTLKEFSPAAVMSRGKTVVKKMRRVSLGNGFGFKDGNRLREKLKFNISML
ncbi:hypothetical protein SteCoe_16340 [Stentor coeruleus]|uniref:Cyclic nucleotide-binding domain-containing protein n=1 Tax=Stentor coeruleus TaxID=5963 RepID=A0A1R2C1G5_9CILI|nr:hypothetical protein SteCoe_16340 [Stentor coeruleus]